MHEKLEAASEEGIPAALSGVSFVSTDRFVVVAVSSHSLVSASGGTCRPRVTIFDFCLLLLLD